MKRKPNMRRDVVEIFQDLADEALPLYQPKSEVITEVLLPKYEGVRAGPVKSLTSEEYLATKRSVKGSGIPQ